MIDLNRAAQILTKDLKAKGIEIKKCELLDTVARMNGHKDWKGSQDMTTFDFTVELNFTGNVDVEIKANSYDDAALKLNKLIEYQHISMDVCDVILCSNGSGDIPYENDVMLGGIAWDQEEFTIDDSEFSEELHEKILKQV